MSLLDQPTTIRAGEELDIKAVDTFVKQVLPDTKGQPTIKQFPGGASNLTYAITYDNHDLILRRPPFGTIAKSAHDMKREAQIMQSLRPVYAYVPQILAICEDHTVMGCDFYLMQRIAGIIPRQNLPKEIDLSVEDTRKLCLNVFDKLVELHNVDYQAAGLHHIGKGPGYVQRQIDGWSARYRKAITEDATDFEAVMAWLKDNQPADSKICVIHNDFRFDNVVLNPQNPFEVVGILDWEMATLGDPLMDLGNSLAYWVQADDEGPFQMMRRQPTHLPGMLTRDELVTYYLEKSGLKIPSFTFYEVYGLFRLAVIIQQIYYRFFHGQTKDERFAGFGFAAKYLEQRCLAQIG